MSVKVVGLEPWTYIALVATLLAWRPVRPYFNRWKRGSDGRAQFRSA